MILVFPMLNAWYHRVDRVREASARTASACFSRRLPGRRSFCVACLLLAGLSLAQAEDEREPSLERRSQELLDIEEQAEAIGAELIGRKADRLALIAELEARERNVAELSLANRELERLVREQTRVATALRARQAEERQALRQEQDLLVELVRTAYVMGRADRLRLLLNQEDPTQASRVLSYFAYFNRERVRRILSVRQRAERLADLARDAEQEAERLAELARSQEATRQRLEQAKQQRALVLTHLEETIASRAENLQTLQKDAESLRLLVEHLRQRAQIRAELGIRRAPFRERKGELSWPILEGRILASFGTPKEDSELRWDGVLLAAREGEEVRAVNDGRIVYADWLRGFGMLLVIDHGDGFMTLYGHNQTLLRELGEWVATGEEIALSGNSGGRDKPVLYFAIRHNGQPQDPVAWCGGAGRQGGMAAARTLASRCALDDEMQVRAPRPPAL